MLREWGSKLFYALVLFAFWGLVSTASAQTHSLDQDDQVNVHDSHASHGDTHFDVSKHSRKLYNFSSVAQCEGGLSIKMDEIGPDFVYDGESPSNLGLFEAVGLGERTICLATFTYNPSRRPGVVSHSHSARAPPA